MNEPPSLIKHPRSRSLPELRRPSFTDSPQSDTTQWVFNITSPGPGPDIAINRRQKQQPSPTVSSTSTSGRRDAACLIISQAQAELGRCSETLAFERRIFETAIEEHRSRECDLKKEIAFTRGEIERLNRELSEAKWRLSNPPAPVVACPVELQPSQGFHYDQGQISQRLLPTQPHFGQGFNHGFASGCGGASGAPPVGHMRGRLINQPQPVQQHHFFRSISLPRM